MNHFGDGKTELLFHHKETDPALMTARTWAMLGVNAFEDEEFERAVGRSKAEDVKAAAV